MKIGIVAHVLIASRLRKTDSLVEEVKSIAMVWWRAGWRTADPGSDVCLWPRDPTSSGLQLLIRE